MATPTPVPALLTDEVLRQIHTITQGLQFGQVVLTVQNGKVTYVDANRRVAIGK